MAAHVQVVHLQLRLSRHCRESDRHPGRDATAHIGRRAGDQPGPVRWRILHRRLDRFERTVGRFPRQSGRCTGLYAESLRRRPIVSLARRRGSMAHCPRSPPPQA